MNKKTVMALILVGGILLILLIVYLMMSLANRETEQASFLDQPNIGQAPLTDQERPEVKQINTEPAKVVKPAELSMTGQYGTEKDLERMAKSFAERFGSFSNQSNFSNIVDLKLFMSAKMKVWADSYIDQNKKSNVSADEYYGVTTRAMSVKLLDYNESAGTASIMVQTRRRESVGTTDNSSKLFNQDVLISFVKEGESWKVDSAYWQE